MYTFVNTTQSPNLAINLNSHKDNNFWSKPRHRRNHSVDMKRICFHVEFKVGLSISFPRKYTFKKM